MSDVFPKGVYLNILVGKTVPKPAKYYVMEAIQNVEVTQTDDGPSGFQIVLKLGSNSSKITSDFAAFNRVIIMVWVGFKKTILIDGIITEPELEPEDEPGVSVLTVTGEDISVVMDRKKKVILHKGLKDDGIARKIIKGTDYLSYGLKADVTAALSKKARNSKEGSPWQGTTDYKQLQILAKRNNYVFYITPGPLPGFNTAYWGPIKNDGKSQKVLSANMSTETNVRNINFRTGYLKPKLVEGMVQDRETNSVTKIKISGYKGEKLAKELGLPKGKFAGLEILTTCGLTTAEARSVAQAITDDSIQDMAVAEGELSVVRYGDLLKPRSKVDVRGVGDNNGEWDVRSVTHILTRGDYIQRFTLTRNGTGSKIKKATT